MEDALLRLTTWRTDNSPLVDQVPELTITIVDTLKGKHDEAFRNATYCLCENTFKERAPRVDQIFRDLFAAQNHDRERTVEGFKALEQFLAEQAADQQRTEAVKTV